MTNNIPQKRVTLGEQGNIPYSWPQIMDSCLSSEVPMDHHHPEPEPMEDRLDDDNNDNDNDDDNTESNMETNLSAYPFDGPTNPEGARIHQALKAKLKSQKRSHHSKFDEIESSVAEFLYADMLPEGCAQHGCRRKVLDHVYGNFQLGA